jgi:cation diffusion facilitator CzcD-associated flavoprotein CzcO
VYRTADGWRCETDAASYVATDVVIATGYNRVPVTPAWPGQDLFHGTIRHSASYREGEPFRGRNVLVVGIGNTGAEIALDLAEHGAQPTISVRSPVVVVPRDYRGRSTQETGLWLLRLRLPVAIRDWLGRAISRRAFGDLEPWGLKRADYGPVVLIERFGRLPVVDIGTIAAIKAGRIAIAPDIARFTSDGVVFVNGLERPFDDVILATGYRPGLEGFLEGADLALDARGYPKRATGDIPGLHFVGFARPKAGMLREIALTAPLVAAAIARSRERKRNPSRIDTPGVST